MARGWESKSVESQQADSDHVRKQQADAKTPDPAYIELIRKKETLLLSRTRVLHELETSQNQRYRQILNNALTDLNAQLSRLAEACAARTAAAS